MAIPCHVLASFGEMPTVVAYLRNRSALFAGLNRMRPVLVWHFYCSGLRCGKDGTPILRKSALLE